MNQSTLLMQIRTALSSISDPLSGKNIIASGRITDLVVNPEGKARFVLSAGEEDEETLHSLLAAAKGAIIAVDGVESVQALATRHSETRTKPAPSSKTSNNAHNNPLGLREFMDKEKSNKQKRIEQTHKALENVNHVIAIASGKGGVGKSTLTVNLGMAFQARGLRVGILDCDVYGPSLPTLLDLKDKPEMRDGKIQPINAYDMKVMSIGLLVDTEKAVAWRGPMVMGAVRQMINDVNWGELDILLVDTPPGTGDAHLTLIQSGHINGAAIVTTPQEMALADVRRGISLFRQTNIPVLGLIENMAWLDMPDGTKQYIFGQGGGKRMAEALDITLLGTVPIDPDLAKASDQGKPITLSSPQSHSTDIIAEIAKKISSQIKI